MKTEDGSAAPPVDLIVGRHEPITKEWLLDNGFQWALMWRETLRIGCVRIDFSDMERRGYPEVIVDPGLNSYRIWVVDHARTRGHVLDLLIALGIR